MIPDNEQFAIANVISERLWRASLTVHRPDEGFNVILTRPTGPSFTHRGMWSFVINLIEGIDPVTGLSQSASSVVVSGECDGTIALYHEGWVGAGIAGPVTDRMIAALVVLNDATDGMLVTAMEREDAVSRRTAARIRAMSEERRVV